MDRPMLDPATRRKLRGQAHHLKPVVMIASKGLTPAVLAEIDRALTAHELIKIRVTGAERVVRAAYLEEICTTLGCAPVQMLGNLLVVWRPNPELQKREARAAIGACKGTNPSSSRAREGNKSATTSLPFVARARQLVVVKGHS